MDTVTLGAALALTKATAGTAANRAEAAAKAAQQAADSIREFNETGITVVDGKLCVKVERS